MRLKPVLVCVVTLLLLVAACAYAARLLLREQVVVGRNWHASERIPITSIDHSAWNALLKKYVDDEGLVNYRAWHASEEDGQALESYLATLSRADTSSQWSRDAALAFWINAYNALTIHGILREYPTDSIRSFTPRFWGYNIWHDLLLPVGDETVSLAEIEGRLRALEEYRIHFALVRASRSCPPLRSEAYSADRIEEQLVAQAERFLNDPRDLRRNVKDGRMQIEWSPILSWYGEDFGPDRATRMHRLAKWIHDEETKRAVLDPDTYVRRNEYDWGLNDSARSRGSSEAAPPEAKSKAANEPGTAEVAPTDDAGDSDAP